MKRSNRLITTLSVIVLLIGLAIIWKSTGFNVDMSTGSGGQNVNVAVGSGGQQFSGAGITFVMPMRTSNVKYGPEGIDYKSKKLAASTDGKMLLVEGKAFGSVTAGDMVDFTEPGIVKVNGVLRTEVSP